MNWTCRKRRRSTPTCCQSTTGHQSAWRPQAIQGSNRWLFGWVWVVINLQSRHWTGLEHPTASSPNIPSNLEDLHHLHMLNQDSPTGRPHHTSGDLDIEDSGPRLQVGDQVPRHLGLAMRAGQVTRHAARARKELEKPTVLFPS